MGFAPTLLFYGAHSVLPWTLTAAVTFAMWYLLGRWRPSLLVVATVGSVLSCLLTVPYADWLTATIGNWYQIGTEDSAMHGPAVAFSWARVGASTLRATLIWIVVNYLFDRYLGYPRYRYAAAAPQDITAGNETGSPAVASGGQLPAFMQRLTRPVTLQSLLAIHAEQHYIKVIAADSQQLVLYRLSDAVRELPGSLGVQVHRSWWVSRNAVDSLQAAGKKMTLVLKNGLTVPVSTPYQALTRASLAAVGAQSGQESREDRI